MSDLLRKNFNAIETALNTLHRDSADARLRIERLEAENVALRQQVDAMTQRMAVLER